jgi:hypothetical protein
VPTEGWVELKAKPIREARALCGCTLGWALVEGADVKEARFLYGMQLVIVPCAARLDHVVLMRSAHEIALEHDDEGPVDLEQVLRQFEKLTGGVT